MKRRFPGFAADAPDVAQSLPEAAGPVPVRGVEQRHALLIANGAYSQAPLRNPRRDTRLVGSALVQLGFAVTRVEDGDLATLRSALTEFVQRLGHSDPDNIAIFYFAGHGVQVDGLNYLIPVRADIQSQDDLETRALALEEVVAMLAASPRQANILVLDACRDGGFSAKVAGRSAFSGGLASLNLPPARMLVAFSTAAGRSADDGTAANSPYATALVETLPRLLEPGRRVHDIFVETAEKVREATRGRQAPALFLQGGLPALTLAPEDADRRNSYDPRGRARARRLVLTTSGVIFAVLVAAFAVLVWAAMAPIDKRALLANVGLADPLGVGLSCATPQTATGPDDYGLSPADWCQLMPDDLYQVSLRTGHLAEAVANGLARGDPKAHFLRAIAAASSFPGKMAALDSHVKDDLIFDLDRAATSGLGIAAAYWEQLFRQNLVSPRPDLLREAAEDGHAIAAAMAGLIAVEGGDPEGGMATLEALRPDDPTGLVAYLLSLILAGEVATDATVDRPRSARLAREAAQKGYLPAIDWLLDLQDAEEIILEQAETDAMMQRLHAAGREEGYWWTFDNLMASGTPKDAVSAMDLLREMMQAFPEGGAAFSFAELATRGIGGPVTAGELSLALDQAIRSQQWGARTLRAEVRMGLAKGADHKPLLPIDPAGAWADLQAAWEVLHDPRALVPMARYHLLGVGGVRDIAAAKAVLQIALDDPAGVSAQVRNLLSSVDLMERMTADRSRADIVIGPSQAPVTVAIYFDPDCRGCAGSGDEVLQKALDWLQATYLQHGFAKLELRPVVKEDRRIHALMRFACFDPATETTVEHLFAAPPGTAEKQQQCIEPIELVAANNARLALLTAAVFSNVATMAPANLPDAAPDASALPPRKGLPVMVVNGWVVSSPKPEMLEATIYRLLAPAEQVRVRDLGARTCQDAARSRMAADLITAPAGQDLPPRLVPLPKPDKPPSGLAADQGVLCADP